MYERSMMTLLAVSLVATGCVSQHKAERAPEKGPDTIVAGPPEAQGPAAPPASSGGVDDVQVNGADRGQIVELRFAYPDNVSATVREQGLEFGPHRVRLIMKQRWTVRPGKDGLHVTSRYVETLPPNKTAEAQRAAALIEQNHAHELKQMVSTLVVDDDAGVVRTEGVAKALRLSRRMHYTSNAQLNAFVQRLTSAIMEAGHVEQQPVQHWIYAVQFWNGQKLSIGQKKEAHFDGYFPTATRGLHKATINVEYMAAGRERCTPQETERRCVRLHLSATADPAQLTLGARRFETKVRSALPEQIRQVMPISKSMSSRLDVEMLVEPDTLLPYRASWHARDRIVMPDGEVKEEDVRRDAVYHYE